MAFGFHFAGRRSHANGINRCGCMEEETFPRSLEDFLLLPEDFGVPEEQQLSLSLENDMDKVIILSENIGRFCREARD